MLASHLRVDGRKQRCSKAKIHVLASHMLFKGCYDFSIVLAFSCEHAKTSQIRYMWTRIFLKMEKKYPFPQISADTSEQSYN